MYQLRVRSDFELSAPEASHAGHDLEIVRAKPAESRPFDPRESTLKYSAATAGVELHKWESTYCLRYHETGEFFFSDARRVSCFVASGASEELVASLLQGPVCAVLLELRGTTCLHSSAVAINNQVVGLLGGTGFGKSSLAAHFVAQGYPLVTDDILPVTVTKGECVAFPSFPQLKLGQDVAKECGLQGTIAPDSRKQLYVVGGAWGGFSSQALPLSVAYVLHREALASTVTIEELGPRDRYVELMRFRFCARAMWPLGLAGSGFEAIAQISQHIPVRRLRYADGLEHLASVCAAIVQDTALADNS